MTTGSGSRGALLGLIDGIRRGSKVLCRSALHKARERQQRIQRKPAVSRRRRVEVRPRDRDDSLLAISSFDNHR